MSSAGQIAGGIIGAVVGFFYGGGPAGAVQGAAWGASIGGYIDPPRGPDVTGPRLTDLSAQTSSYGAVIPRVYGAAAVTGNVIWLEDNKLKETVTTKKSGGKGGGSKSNVTTYSYSATFAVALCKGPIVGVKRIWVGANLIYDAGASDADTITASNQAQTGFRVYLGSDTQQPDPRMQATLGVNATPAWRGVAYIVFYDLQLARYSNSLMGAQVRVEVLQTGSSYVYPATTFTQPSFSWTAPVWDGTVWCSVARYNHVVALSADGLNWSTASIPNGNSPVYQGVATDGAGVLLVYGVSATNVWRSTDHGASWQSVTLPGFTGYVTHIVHNGSYYLAVTDSGPFFSSPNGLTWTSRTPPVSGTAYGKTLCWHQASGKWYVHDYISTSKSIWATSDLATWTPVYTLTGDLNNFDVCCVHNNRLLYMGVGTVTTYGSCLLWSDDGVTWDKVQPPQRSAIFSAGQNCWIGVSNSTMYYSADGVTNWTQWTRPAQTASSYAHGYANGLIVCMGDSVAVGFRVQSIMASALPTTLSAIVSSECLSSGLLSAGDIDASALTQSVRGYRVANVGPIRSAIEPLQSAWPFDAVQRGYVISFVPRGAASVFTIPQGDLNARGVSTESGVRLALSRETDAKLPRRVTVQHLDVDREYNTGSQYAERINTTAVNAISVDLPVVLTAAEAAGKAEVLLYLQWLERLDASFTLPPTYAALEPADVVSVVVEDATYQLRLTAINTTSDGWLECRAKPNAQALYTPAALGAASAVSGATAIAPLGAAVYALLDTPLLHSAQASGGYLAAMTSATSGWRGGSLLQSTDSGSTWVSIQDFGGPGAVIASCSNALPSVDSRMLDTASVLSVTLVQGALYSVTQTAMLGGANLFAYGSDGRWEIISAQTCTQVSGNNYTLRDMVRGRYGTEWAMSQHAVGDTLVLLDSTSIAVVGAGTQSIGTTYLYRGVTSGRDISTDPNRSFTYAAENLRPLSPIYLTGNRDSGGDWVLSWVRRTRDGGEWRDYVDAALGETAESYAVDIYSDATYTSVKRTISVSTPGCAYLLADQTADFGTGQSTLYLKVYQMSSVVGRGRALTQTITR